MHRRMRKMAGKEKPQYPGKISSEIIGNSCTDSHEIYLSEVWRCFQKGTEMSIYTTSIFCWFKFSLQEKYESAVNR